jgi:hypothetical protein
LGVPALVADVEDRLHLVQVVADNSGALQLIERSWHGDDWQAGETSILDANLSEASYGDLAVNVAPDNHLAAVYTAELVPPDGEAPIEHLYFSERNIELPAFIPANQSTQTVIESPMQPLPTPAPTTMPTTSPVARPILESSTDAGDGPAVNESNQNSTTYYLLRGLAPVGLIAVFIFVFGLLIARLRHRSRY